MSEIGTNRGSAVMRIVIGAAILGFVLWRLTCKPSAADDPAEQADADFRNLHGKLELYADTYSGLPKSFEKLVKTEEGMPKLLEAVPRDPWGQPYHLELRGGTDYTILSNGPDTAAGTEDDLRSPGSWVPDQR